MIGKSLSGTGFEPVSANHSTQKNSYSNKPMKGSKNSSNRLSSTFGGGDSRSNGGVVGIGYADR